MIINNYTKFSCKKIAYRLKITLYNYYLNSFLVSTLTILKKIPHILRKLILNSHEN